jgi:sodium-dependent dicarboxylate transporter 2/3/5
MKKAINILSGPILALLFVLFIDLEPTNPLVSRMAAITIWVAVWWLFEVVDIGVSAFLPLILMPLCGIMDAKVAANQYIDHIIFLFIGGFLIAFALEKWHLHHRISLRILMTIGDNPAKILAGMMFTAYFISAWMSNTATTLMLYPAVLAVYTHVKSVSGKPSQNIAIALLLGLAYSASIGGMATLVGTPTNMIFYGYFKNKFPDDTTLNFLSWCKYGVPVSMGMLVACYVILRTLYIKKADNIPFDKSYFSEGYKRLGEWSREQLIVTFFFVLTVILWFTRADIDLGMMKFEGWGHWFSFNVMENGVALVKDGKNVMRPFVEESTIAVLIAALFFFIPAKTSTGEKTTLLTWEDAQKIPLNILLLFGAGFALGKGFEVSGLSEWIAGRLKFLEGESTLVLIMCICVVICIISEFASNVASIQLSLPILMAITSNMHIDPIVLMLPATLAASLGFMLPVATAPNTIVFSSGLIPVRKMLSAGFFLDIIGIILITLVFMLG